MDLIIVKAKAFATAAHGATDQRRKYTNEPYIGHPTAVAEMVAAYGGSNDMIAAAYLHDVVEDTHLEVDDIRAEFGEIIASMVDALTNKAKKADGTRLKAFITNCQALKKNLDDKTMIIKLCDLLHNTSTITDHDHDFAAIYLAEKEFMLDEIFGSMKGGLMGIARAKLARCYEQLNDGNKARHSAHLINLWTAWGKANG